MALPSELIPAELTEQTSPPTTLPTDVPTTGAALWFVGPDGGEEQLVACEVPVPEAAETADRVLNMLRELVQLNPAEDENCATSLTNSLPPDLTIVASSLSGNILDLDLSALGTVSATAQRLAVAQIVFTATEHPEVSAVRFSIDGERRAVPLEDATAEPGAAVTRSDFPRFNRSAAAQSELTAEEVDNLLRYLAAVEAAETAERDRADEPESSGGPGGAN
ncbi:MAG: GerMN domain-containing protein [Acidimicrobiia bacterium]|nr:GerMN domain-containing protein [Acidimicrobiia bacterium]